MSRWGLFWRFVAQPTERLSLPSSCQFVCRLSSRQAVHRGLLWYELLLGHEGSDMAYSSSCTGANFTCEGLHCVLVAQDGPNSIAQARFNCHSYRCVAWNPSGAVHTNKLASVTCSRASFLQNPQNAFYASLGLYCGDGRVDPPETCDPGGLGTAAVPNHNAFSFVWNNTGSSPGATVGATPGALCAFCRFTPVTSTSFSPLTASLVLTTATSVNTHLV